MRLAIVVQVDEETLAVIDRLALVGVQGKDGNTYKRDLAKRLLASSKVHVIDVKDDLPNEWEEA